MIRPIALCLASISVFIFSCQEQASTVKTTVSINDNVPVADTTYTPPARPKVYRDFHLENALRNGYRFGMTLSEWNKHLANLAENGTAKELSKVSIVDGPGSDLKIGSYKAFFPIDASDNIQRSREGFYICGLFAQPQSQDGADEVFRINGTVTDEPILIGIQVDCSIPDYRINGAIQAMVDKDELQPLAGGRLPYTTDEPLDAIDFRDAVAEGIGRMNREMGKENDDERYAQMVLIDRTLLQSPLFYCVLELTETRRAEVVRNGDYRVQFISNAYRSYHLVQKIYSKKQSNLDIEKYMTPDERQNYQSTNETRKLIEEARQ
jgi:hypothetical protein